MEFAIWRTRAIAEVLEAELAASTGRPLISGIAARMPTFQRPRTTAGVVGRSRLGGHGEPLKASTRPKLRAPASAPRTPHRAARSHSREASGSSTSHSPSSASLHDTVADHARPHRRRHQRASASTGSAACRDGRCSYIAPRREVPRLREPRPRAARGAERGYAY